MMVINELYKSAKSLNDAELQKLISKLQSFLERKREKAERKAKLLHEKQEKAQKAIEEIERTVLASGLTLKQLGLVSPCDTQLAHKNPSNIRKSHTYNAENLNYTALNDKAVEMIFGRKLVMLRQHGKALRFSDLNPKQKKHAQQLVEAKNAKAN